MVLYLTFQHFLSTVHMTGQLVSLSISVQNNEKAYSLVSCTLKMTLLPFLGQCFVHVTPWYKIVDVKGNYRWLIPEIV